MTVGLPLDRLDKRLLFRCAFFCNVELNLAWFRMSFYIPYLSKLSTFANCLSGIAKKSLCRVLSTGLSHLHSHHH